MVHCVYLQLINCCWCDDRLSRCTWCIYCTTFHRLCAMWFAVIVISSDSNSPIIVIMRVDELKQLINYVCVCKGPPGPPGPPGLPGRKRRRGRRGGSRVIPVSPITSFFFSIYKNCRSIGYSRRCWPLDDSAPLCVRYSDSWILGFCYKLNFLQNWPSRAESAWSLAMSRYAIHQMHRLYWFN